MSSTVACTSDSAGYGAAGATASIRNVSVCCSPGVSSTRSTPELNASGGGTSSARRPRRAVRPARRCRSAATARRRAAGPGGRAVRRWGCRSARDRLLPGNPSALPTSTALLLFGARLVSAGRTYGGSFQYSSLSNLLTNNAHLLILAVGMTCVIRTGGIDLSVGAVIAFSSVAGVMLANAGWSPWLVILAMIGVGLLFGAIAGALVEFFDVQPFIATLATMFLGRGLASMLSTTPERLADDSPIRLLSQRITLVDGPGVNDL